MTKYNDTSLFGDITDEIPNEDDFDEDGFDVNCAEDDWDYDEDDWDYDEDDWKYNEDDWDGYEDADIFEEL